MRPYSANKTPYTSTTFQTKHKFKIQVWYQTWGNWFCRVFFWTIITDYWTTKFTFACCCFGNKHRLWKSLSNWISTLREVDQTIFPYGMQNAWSQDPSCGLSARTGMLKLNVNCSCLFCANIINRVICHIHTHTCARRHRNIIYMINQLSIDHGHSLV